MQLSEAAEGEAQRGGEGSKHKRKRTAVEEAIAASGSTRTEKSNTATAESLVTTASPGWLLRKASTPHWSTYGLPRKARGDSSGSSDGELPLRSFIPRAPRAARRRRDGGTKHHLTWTGSAARAVKARHPPHWQYIGRSCSYRRKAGPRCWELAAAWDAGGYNR